MESSANTAYSLYEKYTHLNHQVDETREKRGGLLQEVATLREALEHFDTDEQPTLVADTLQARKESVLWETKADQAVEELRAQQLTRDALVWKRDQLAKDSSGRQQERRLECRNFLAESQSFRFRECPALQFQLSMLPAADPTARYGTARITRLHALALAKGWSTEGLPAEILPETSEKKAFDELKEDSSGETDWEFWDSIFVEEEDDDEDIRRKLIAYHESRHAFDIAKQEMLEVQDRVQGKVEEEYQACRKRKQQLTAQLERLSKENQQLEIEISTELAFRDLQQEEGISSATASADTAFVAVPTTRTATTTSTSMRVSLSPHPPEHVTNPYKRQSAPDQSANRKTTKKGRRSATKHVPQPSPPSYASRPRYNSSRKRKSAFGSSMEIGGAEMRNEPAPAPSTAPMPLTKEILKEFEDDTDDEDLFSWTPFGRKTGE
jgi:hypothetical protein